MPGRLRPNTKRAWRREWRRMWRQLCPARPQSRRATRLRLVSVFRQGWITIRVALLRQELWPLGRFVPDPWPFVPPWEEEAHEPVMPMPDAA